MDPAQAEPRALDAPEFVDGLGERLLLTDAASGESVEVLQLRPVLTGVPSFEFALRERTARLANFRQQAFARVRRVDRTPEGLAIVSDHVAGFRLSQMLRIAEERGLAVDTNAALCLIRQLLPAVVLLHENARDVAHGALAPERLIVTPHARLVVAEYVLGSALEQLQLTHDRLWRDYRIPMPPSAGAPRFDHRADVMQIGVASLSLVLGRTLQDDELGRISELLAESTETSAGGARQPLSQGLRGWLARALQVDPRRPFQTARDAQTAFDQMLAAEGKYVASTIAVEAFISRCVDSIIEGAASLTSPGPETPAPSPAAAPSAVMLPAPLEVPPAAASPAAATPAPRVPEAPAVYHHPEPLPIPELPRMPEAPLPEPPRALDPGRSAQAPSGLDIPDVDRIERTFADRDAHPLFNEPMEEPEEVLQEPARRASGRRSPWMKVAVALIALAAIAGGGYYGITTYWRKAAAAPAADTGTLVVQSTPAGVQVVVDGVAQGVTPARLSLKTGPHILELRGKGVPRVIPITMTAGGTLSQFIEFAETAGATTGHLNVRSEPAGARVSVDGRPAGTAPTVISDLAPGEHRVVLEREGTTVQHTVVIEAGATASLVAPLGAAASGPASGWFSVAAPFAMQVFEGGRLVGTSETDRIMVPAGRHEFEIVNETLGYRVMRVVNVPPGKLATVGIDLPNGVVNINAVPWAEVWVDNKRIGETPIGNVSLTIGPHEVVFRHPQFGEKRQAIAVTASTPVRVSVDMRK